MKANFITKPNQTFPSITSQGYPIWAQKYISETQKSINCSEEYLNTLFLSMCSICIGKSTSLKVKNNWKEYSSLFTVIIGSPSSKKSPSMSAIFQPLENIQKQLENNFNQAYVSYKEEVKQKKRDKDDTHVIKPVKKHLYLTDVTMESLSDELNNNPLGILLKKDEINHFFSSMGKYSNSGGGDLETILELYGLQSSAISRRNREGVLQTFKPFFSIVGGIQFKPFKDFFIGKENGIIERFIFSMPKIKIKSEFSDYEIDNKTINEYFKKVSEVYQFSNELIENKKEIVCELSPEAKELWIQWQNTMPDSEELDSMFEKAKARALRIGLILHVLKYPKRNKTLIEYDTFHHAILISNYFINSHIQILEDLKSKEFNEKVQHALDWFFKHYQNPRFFRMNRSAKGCAIRDFYTYNNSKFKTADETRKFLEMLECKGYGRIVEGESKNSPTIFSLHKWVIDEKLAKSNNSEVKQE
jgi:hypothetical protein